VQAIRELRPADVADLIARSPALVSACHEGSFGSTPLIHGVLMGDRGIVDMLLGAGADVDQRSDWWAGSFGVLDHASDEMAEYLLGRGATLTPHAAARLGMLDELRSMIERDPDRVRERGGDGQLPLHFARTPEIADLLLEAGADIDARDVDHESTAAHWQATRRPTVASHLVDRGAEPDPFLAAATGRLDLLERLAATDPDVPHARISRERFSTHGAGAAEHIYFYTLGEGMTVLHAAALTDRADSIRWLLEAGADVNARGGYDEQTPLHTAAWNDAVAAATALLDARADMAALSGKIHRNDPLGWAVVSGAAHAVRLLVSRGATVTAGHRETAEAGAKGLFRAYNRERDPEMWVEIRNLLR